MGARIGTDFTEGMDKADGKFVFLLNVQQALSTGEIGALTPVVEALAPPGLAQA